MGANGNPEPKFTQRINYNPRRKKPRNVVLVQEDLGDRIIQTRMELPVISTRVETKTIPKKSSGHWKKLINVDRVRFVKSTDTERIMVFDRFTGEFLFELQEHDLMGLLKVLLKETGAIRANIHSKYKGKTYYDILIVGKVRKEILDFLDLSGT